MSLQQAPRATLRGYEGPLYPITITALARAFTARNPCGLSDEHIALAAKQCAGLDFIRPHPVTGDGHVWRCAIIFQADVGKVLILLPMTCDNVESGEMRLDRAPAAYTRDGANRRAAEAIVARFVRALHAVNDSLAAE